MTTGEEKVGARGDEVNVPAVSKFPPDEDFNSYLVPIPKRTSTGKTARRASAFLAAGKQWAVKQQVRCRRCKPVSGTLLPPFGMPEIMVGIFAATSIVMLSLKAAGKGNAPWIGFAEYTPLFVGRFTLFISCSE